MSECVRRDALRARVLAQMAHLTALLQKLDGQQHDDDDDELAAFDDADLVILPETVGTKPPPSMSSDGSSTSAGGPTPANATVLPDGLSNLEDWGRTIIDFGNVHKGKMYTQVCQAAESDEKVKRYLTWVRALSCASPMLLDFQAYLALACPEPAAGPCFPGSSRPRRLGPHPSA
jgi:hypothetical protein